MSPDASDRWDPVQQYWLRQARIRWIAIGAVVLVAVLALYWFVYWS
jgi:hypothetical protein